MKIILEFNDDEVKQAEQAYRGPECARAASDFALYLRNITKHGDYDGETLKLIEQIRYDFHDFFNGLLND